MLDYVARFVHSQTISHGVYDEIKFPFRTAGDGRKGGLMSP